MGSIPIGVALLEQALGSGSAYIDAEMASRWMTCLAIASALTGCAEVLGLDSGAPLEDDAGLAIDDLPGEAGASDDGGVKLEDASTPDAGSTAEAGSTPDASSLICAAGKADCNGVEKDGCETNLDDSAHCGSCANACGPKMACRNQSCCSNPHAPCTADGDCCSGKCDEEKGCH